MAPGQVNSTKLSIILTPRRDFTGMKLDLEP